MSTKVSSVALIGSFRQHYDEVLESLSVFEAIGLAVTTPKGDKIQEHGIPFVRFESDKTKWTDEIVQAVALHRILRADFVFVVAPNGYVGRTTCYEIGRIIQARRALYFSDRPEDLPLWIPDSHICSAISISELIEDGDFQPEVLHGDVTNIIEQLEWDLLNGQYKHI